MALMTVPDRSILIVSLRGCVCPACGKGKSRARTLCLRCFLKLDEAEKSKLSLMIGDGYEAALASAFATLGRSTFRTERV